MTWRGIAYRLPPSAPRTAVTGSSPLLPTPRASLNELRTGKRTPSQETGKHGRYLSSEVMRLLPTPCARDWKGEGYKGQLPTEMRLLPTPNASLCNYEEEPETWEPRRAAAAERHGNNGIGMPLPIALKLLPTPEASDGTGGRVSREKGGTRDSGAKRAVTLATAIHHQPRGSQSIGASTSPPSGAGKPSTGLRLNPLFPAWMMGTPSCGECGREWTDPDCPHSVTAFTFTSDGSSGRP